MGGVSGKRERSNSLFEPWEWSRRLLFEASRWRRRTTRIASSKCSLLAISVAVSTSGRTVEASIGTPRRTQRSTIHGELLQLTACY